MFPQKKPNQQETATNLMDILKDLQFGASDFTDLLFDEASPAQEFRLPMAAPEPAPPEEAPKSIIVDSGKRLSECRLWEWHERYYDNMGADAWDCAVPCFATSSAMTADAYADAVLAFLEDHLAIIDPREPVYIIELAAGVGRLGFLLMTELEKRMAYFSHLKQLSIRYIMTDFTQNNIDFWRKHEKFGPLIEKGVLDVARFCPEKEQTLHLQISDRILDASAIKNPVFAIANYFFDTIAHDVFMVSGGKLHEGLTELEWHLPEESMSALQAQERIEAGDIPFADIEVRYHYNELPDTRYYDDERFNQILEAYRSSIIQGSVIFPIAGLRVLRNLQALSGNRLALLSSDKAFTTPEHMLLHHQHHFAAHGSFSYQVNYDAIGQFFRNENGHYLYTSNQCQGLQTICCLMMPHADAPRPERLHYLFQEKLSLPYAIISSVEVVDKQLVPGKAELPTEQIQVLLSNLRINLADPRTFCIVAEHLLKLMDFITPEQRNDLLQLMRQSWEKYYFFRGERNVGYWFGEIYYRLGMFEESIKCLEVAKQGYAEYQTDYLLIQGRCYEKLNRWPQAIQAYEDALAIDPNYIDAGVALNNLRTRLSAY